MNEAPITLILLLLNVLVSGYALFMDQSLIDRFAFKPRNILQGREWYRMVTGGFVHAGIAHLAFNMIALYSFGRGLEQIIGPAAFLIVYFGAEMAAHALTLSIHRDNPHYAAVGASGAVSGVIFGFVLFAPFSTLIIFPLPIPIWAIIFAPAYIFLSIYAMQSEGSGVTGGIAHEAHLGGAIGGLLLTILVEPRSIQIFLGQLGII